MKALLLVNHNGGNGKIADKVNCIVNSLLEIYETVDFFICEKEEEFVKHCIKSCGVYDSLLFAGGDGTFHLAINALAKMDDAPILGVLPSGTLCDAAKNFGASKNIKKALKLIKKGKVLDFDIAKINDQYFVFEASHGVYSDIPYTCSKSIKKRFKHFAYYLKAVPEMMKISKYDYDLILDDNKKISIETPFLLIMNSSYMAGFKINKKSDIADGLIDVFYSKCEPFNGLFSYFVFKKRVTHYQVKKIQVLTHNDGFWDIDGEKGMNGNVTIEVLPKKFKMFYKNKNN